MTIQYPTGKCATTLVAATLILACSFCTPAFARHGGGHHAGGIRGHRANRINNRQGMVQEHFNNSGLIASTYGRGFSASNTYTGAVPNHLTVNGLGGNDTFSLRRRQSILSGADGGIWRNSNGRSQENSLGNGVKYYGNTSGLKLQDVMVSSYRNPGSSQR